MTYETLRLCSGRAAYEAVPRPRLDLDLPDLRRKLEEAGVDVVDARVMLIARMEREVTVSRDGRILIKTSDVGEADRLLHRLRAIAELPE